MDASTVTERIARLFEGRGVVDWPTATGTIHVAAVQDETGHVIAIGPEAPKSGTDRFVLGFARARADVIVTTGSILRSEPDLVHRLAESPEEQSALAAWRQATLGREDRPRLLVLSGSGRFPTDHPALAAAQGWIWTTREGRQRCGTPPDGFDFVVPGEDTDDAEDANGVAAALAWLLAQDDVDTLSLEAGPSTTAALYDRAERAGVAFGGVDELLLSRFEGDLAEAADGPDFVPAQDLLDRFGAPATSIRVLEESGPWRFERWRA